MSKTKTKHLRIEETNPPQPFTTRFYEHDDGMWSFEVAQTGTSKWRTDGERYVTWQAARSNAWGFWESNGAR